MLFLRQTLRVVLFPILLSPLALASDTGNSQAEVPGRDAILSEMTSIIVPSLKRRDTAYPIFHGSVDWHSSVHGHWAVFRVARITGKNTDATEFADQSMDPALLPQEAKIKRDQLLDEMPYGRAWFLRLATEFELWSRENKRQDPLRLRALANELADSLLTHFEKDPAAMDPSIGEYQNPSWALVQLHAYYRFTGDTAGLNRAQALIKTLLSTDSPIRFADDSESGHYFSPFGNWTYLAAKATTPDERDSFLKRFEITDPEIAVSGELSPASRRLGLMWNRAWCLKTLSFQATKPVDQERFWKAYLAHVAAAMSYHEASKTNWLYTHWIPQFAVYALTEDGASN